MWQCHEQITTITNEQITTSENHESKPFPSEMKKKIIKKLSLHTQQLLYMPFEGTISITAHEIMDEEAQRRIAMVAILGLIINHFNLNVCGIDSLGKHIHVFGVFLTL